MSGPDRRVLGLSIQGAVAGYAVVEFPSGLFRWGTLTDRSESKTTLLERIRVIIGKTDPTELAIDDPEAWGYPKCRRSKDLIEAVQAEAKARRLPITLVSGPDLRSGIGVAHDARRHEIASALAVRFEELQSYLPPERKFYEREADRMAMFMAVGIALAS